MKICSHLYNTFDYCFLLTYKRLIFLSKMPVEKPLKIKMLQKLI